MDFDAAIRRAVRRICASKSMAGEGLIRAQASTPRESASTAEARNDFACLHFKALDKSRPI